LGKQIHSIKLFYGWLLNLKQQIVDVENWTCDSLMLGKSEHILSNGGLMVVY